ncbi:MAG: hypothetical protein GTO76_11880 [Planctomycetales bacterium]|nr:hypothetical protein [Planctomycetales bacterium]NIN78428.1 hypothetical protein [Planctomycetales bacterium]NIO35619.1 hypothetical protein [Planctomycetales bacterium]NIO47367.1 hypothetical protein [Planctomycetales bacterium]NIP05498.1 hypothetical protein [Planctomycetales bacterium]
MARRPFTEAGPTGDLGCPGTIRLAIPAATPPRDTTAARLADPRFRRQQLLVPAPPSPHLPSRPPLTLIRYRLGKPYQSCGK